MYKKDEHFSPEWWQRRYTLCLLQLGMNTRAGKHSDIGTVESNKALQHHLRTRGSLSNNPREGKRIRNTPTIEDVMHEGSNLTIHMGGQSRPSGLTKHVPRPYGLQYMENGRSRAAPRPNESLGDWLSRIGYSAYKKAITKSGIKTLMQLAECRLSEVDLDDFGMVQMLPRRRFLAHVAALYQHKRKGKIKAVIQQLQDGLAGRKEVELHHLGRQRPASANTKGATAESDRFEVARALAATIRAHWSSKAHLTDLVSLVIFPVFFALNFMKLAPQSSGWTPFLPT